MKNNKEITANLCRCGSDKITKNCCALLISGEKQASSAEQLMRSRFVAYATGNLHYVQATWHSSTRPADVANVESMQWLRLEIISTSETDEESGQAYVEFKATYKDSGMQESLYGILHERSRFIVEDGCWRYVDGEQFDTDASKTIKKPGRNEPCFCGSGKKYKKCCGNN